jgi:ubiquitin C-terminal hydrolase
MPLKQRRLSPTAAELIPSNGRFSIDNIPALPNDNRSCYANSALQCLHRLSDLYESIAAANFLDHETNRIAVAFCGALMRVRGKTVRKFRDLIGLPFSTNQDQDAVEFLEHLLNIFQHKSQFFAFSAITQKNCAICGFNTVIRQQFDHLRLSALAPDGPLNFNALLEASIAHLSFPNEDRINCKRCSELTVSIDQRFVEHNMPQYVF